MKNSRETAFHVLYQVLEEGEYSHLVLARVLKAEEQAEKRDRAFSLLKTALDTLILSDFLPLGRNSIP